MEVTWDPAKNDSNIEKYGISFNEAAELFRSGVDYFEIFDEAHSVDEDRFLAIGPISRGLVLVVHTEQNEDTIRIISARWATKVERELFLAYMDEST
ncbi:MAG: BrnT family toxin [Myxococcales bacterium]|nr:BrnT family toxin [Myxococcales bacterium]